MNKMKKNSRLDTLDTLDTNSNQGDFVVYQLYKSGHNTCKRKSMGTYKLGVDSFVRAYTRQMEVEYEAKGGEYEVDEDAMGYLQCQQYYYNNNLVSRMFGNIDKSCILRVHVPSFDSMFHHM
jgi:hypothetical protein